MGTAIRTRIVRIGNSQGIRIPKPLLEQSGISEEVEIEIQDGHLILRAAARSRAGWEEQFAAMAKDEGLLDEGLLDEGLLDEGLLDDITATEWDQTEWEW